MAETSAIDFFSIDLGVSSTVDFTFVVSSV